MWECLLVLPQCNGVSCAQPKLFAHITTVIFTTKLTDVYTFSHPYALRQLSSTMHAPSCILQRSATHAWAQYYVCTVGSVRGAGQKKSRMEPCLRWRLRLPG